MTTINFGIRLTADGDAFVGNVRVAKAEFDKLTGGIEQGAKRAAAASEQLNSSIRTLAGIGAGAFGIGEVLRYGKALADTADAASNVRSRLSLVAGTASNTAQVYNELFRIAQASRVSFEDLAGTYAQMARSADESGISQERMLKVTQALSQAITVSGGSAASAQAAMVQLSQGLASGTLRGEELNSILEQTPRVAQAIASGLGVGIGQLRKLGEEGKLTAEAVVGALERSSPAIAAEFARMTPTIGQAFTQLGNSGLNLVGTLDQMAGASSGVATGLGKMADGVDVFAKAIADNPIVTTYLEALKFAASGGPAGALYRRLNPDPNAGVTPEGASRLTGEVEGRRAYEQRSANARAAYLADPANLSKDQRRVAALVKAEEDFQKTMRAQAGASQDSVDQLFGAYRQRLSNIDEQFKEKKAGGGAARTAAADRKQALAADLADERAAIEFSERLKIQAIESLGKQGLRSEEQVIAERKAIQLESLASQIAAAQKQRDVAGADLSEHERATATINGLMRERLQVEAQATNELAELATKRVDTVIAEGAKLAAERQRDLTSQRESLRTMADENQARLRAIATGRDEAEMLIELRIARQTAALAAQGEAVDPVMVERINLLREELLLLRERRQIDAEQGDRRAADSQAQRLADDFARREQDITRSLTDALYRGFENGKGLAENFRDTLRSTIGTLVLRPLIEPVVKPLANAASGFIEQLVGTGLNALAGAAAGGVDWSSAPDQFDAETARLGRTKNASGAAGGTGVNVSIPQTFYINAGVDATTAMNIVQTSKAAALAEIRDATSRNDPSYTG